MNNQVSSRRRRSERGAGLLDIVLALGLASVIAGVSIQQVVATRRLIRAGGLTQELVGGLRDARQMAISRRRAITFQYDDAAKQVKLIDHGVNAQGYGNSGTAVTASGSYPNTPGSSSASTTTLTDGGLTSADIAYGAPSDIPTAASTLPDKVKVNNLTNKKLNITFQPDGTIVDANNLTRDFALAIYNPANSHDTVTAISILGATGRIKAWRYSDSVKKFVD